MDISNYVAKGKLTSREIKLLKKDIDIYREKVFEAGVTGYNRTANKVNHDARKCKIFFAKAFEFPNTFNIIQSCIMQSYYDIAPYIDFSNIAEVQYVKYEEGEFFKIHRDTIYRRNDTRCLTFSINVSEKEQYDEGELFVIDVDNNKKTYLDKDLGSYIIFPSILHHEAKKVKNGTREAIVTWIHVDDKTFNRFHKDLAMYSNDVKKEIKKYEQIILDP